MTGTIPSRGAISRREQDVEVGLVQLETRIIKESTYGSGDIRRMVTSGHCFMAWVKGLCAHLRAWRRLSNSEVVL